MPDYEHFEPVTAEKAEKLTGFRLDRRRKYFKPKGLAPQETAIFVQSTYTHTCSGCCEPGDYGLYTTDPEHNCSVGSGCEECGYTGKRRTSTVTPVYKDMRK